MGKVAGPHKIGEIPLLKVQPVDHLGLVEDGQRFLLAEGEGAAVGAEKETTAELAVIATDAASRRARKSRPAT